jgi:hypothetical protein
MHGNSDAWKVGSAVRLALPPLAPRNAQASRCERTLTTNGSEPDSQPNHILRRMDVHSCYRLG